MSAFWNSMMYQGTHSVFNTIKRFWRLYPLRKQQEIEDGLVRGTIMQEEY